jgi:DNA repair exonuclease SbcCD ATPase subunit
MPIPGEFIGRIHPMVRPTAAPHHSKYLYSELDIKGSIRMRVIAMADIFGEISGTMKKAMETIDKRQKTLVDEIKKDGSMIVDRAAETSEKVIESIDSHIENLKDAAENPEASIEQLENFLETLKGDIENLTEVVDQRAKELQIAVKKNSEIVLEEIGEDLNSIQGILVNGLKEAQGEADESKRNAIIDGIITKVNELSTDLGQRMEELKDSGEEVSQKAVAEAEKQMGQLSKALGDLRDNFPVRAAITSGEPEKKAPVKKPKKVAKPKE